jgi:response regulator RpfG family c-di-GMP phosphodiesterase
MRGFQPDKKIAINPFLTRMYLFGGLFILTDATWEVLTLTGSPEWFDYFVNLVYFLASMLGILSWFYFCTQTIESVFYKKPVLRYVSAIPAVATCILILSSPFSGLIFTVTGGVYQRGPVFAANVITNMLYLSVTAAISVITALKTKSKKIKHISVSFLLYEIPVILCGVLQAVTGYDFNCAGLTLSLLLLYSRGIANTTRDSSELIYSILNSFDASFIVNAEKNTLKVLSVGKNYKGSIDKEGRDGFENYGGRIKDLIEANVVPEDKNTVLESFDIGYIRQKIKKEHVFSIIYRTYDNDRKIIYHKTTFMNAENKFEQSEFLICIQNIDLNKYESERNASLIEQNARLSKINEDIFLIAGAVIEARDMESGEHVFRVKEYTRLLANQVMEDFPEYNLTNEKISYITAASALHDLGKIMIPDSILLKAGKLTPEEFEIMKTHTVKGCELIDRFPLESAENYIKCAREICRWHHEKYDGKGYPDGLCGEEIPISAQIVSIVDCYDALTQKRVYKEARSADESYSMIINGECGAFSDKILFCFEKVKDNFASLVSKSYEE